MPQSPHYAIAGREVIAETPDLRVVLMTLAPGEATPWHRHTKIADTAFALSGAVRVEMQVPLHDEPDERHDLALGAHVRVEPGCVHRVVNAGNGPCSFLLVQGVGVYDFIKAG